MEELRGSVKSALSIVFGVGSGADAINAANSTLMAVQRSEGCTVLCVDVIRRPDDERMLYWACHTLGDTVAMEWQGNNAVVLKQTELRADVLKCVVLHAQRTRTPMVMLALSRLFGRIAACCLLGSDWKTAVADCASLNCAWLALGALEQMAELGTKMPSKAASALRTRMCESAPLVCRTCVQVAGLVNGGEPAVVQALQRNSFRTLVSWLRFACIPMSVLIPSGSLEYAVSHLHLAEALEMLTEVFATPVLSFRSAGSVASFTLSFDDASHRHVVTFVAQRLMQAGQMLASKADAQCFPLVRLLCEVVRQHPSLLFVVDGPTHPLLRFLLLCFRQLPEEPAMHTLSVWCRLQQDILEKHDVFWDETFSEILRIILRKWGPSVGDGEAFEDTAERRLLLSETILCCAQVVGEASFFETLKSDAPSLEVALWAATSASALHDGRTPFALPSLFGGAFAQDPTKAPTQAMACCQAIWSFRLFLKQFDDGRLVPIATRYCGASLSICPADAAKALLALAELCGEKLASDIPVLIPLCAKALPLVNADTAHALVSTCAELVTNLSEPQAEPLVSELLDVVLSALFVPALVRSRESFVAAAVALCNRSLGRCQGVFASRLARFWPGLCTILQEGGGGGGGSASLSSSSSSLSDSVCDLMCALAVAAGAGCAPHAGTIAKEMLVWLWKSGASTAVKGLRFLITLSESLDNNLFVVFGDACRGVMQFMQKGTPEDGQVCCAFFDLMKRAIWSPHWRSALAVRPDSPLASALRFLEGAFILFGSDFECLGALSDFLVELVVAAALDPQLIPHIHQQAPLLVCVLVKGSIQGNPLALRFYAAPLFDLLQKLDANVRMHLLSEALSKYPQQLPGHVVSRAAQIGAQIAQSRRFKAFLSDVSEIARGRETIEALDAHAG